MTPQLANQPIVTATDTYVGPQGERSDEAGLFRVSAGGFGRFGMDMKYAAGREHLELYGAGVDFQYNLLPEERFNLWVGVGYSYAPEQDACKYTEQYNYSSNGATWSETYAGKFELKAHDFRLMLIPEWQICENFALGLRMGVSLGFYDGKLMETYTYADDWGLIPKDLTLTSRMIQLFKAWSVFRLRGFSLSLSGLMSIAMHVLVMT